MDLVLDFLHSHPHYLVSGTWNLVSGILKIYKSNNLFQILLIGFVEVIE
jgi:hypothetical protein